ncbi:hypothetical protein ACJX0J_040576, partial [Zea mays]
QYMELFYDIDNVFHTYFAYHSDVRRSVSMMKQHAHKHKLYLYKMGQEEYDMFMFRVTKERIITIIVKPKFWPHKPVVLYDALENNRVVIISHIATITQY